MKKIPSIITNSIQNGKTLLGSSSMLPCDSYYLIKLLTRAYNIFSVDELDITSSLRECITDCEKIEMRNKRELENLCTKIMTEEFDIPTDTIVWNIEFVSKIENTDNILFDDKKESYTQNIKDYIYKFYMLNSIISGCAIYTCVSYLQKYKKDIDSIDNRLFSLYNKVIRLYVEYIYNTTEAKIEKNKDLVLSDDNILLSDLPNKPVVNCYGVLFPFVIESSIRGLLELAIINGLPNNKKEAMFVLEKTNLFKTKAWQIRLGLGFWLCFNDIFKKLNTDERYMGMNYFIAYISVFDYNQLSSFVKHVIDKDNESINAIKDISEKIIKAKKQESDNLFLGQQNDLVPLEDSLLKNNSFVG